MEYTSMCCALVRNVFIIRRIQDRNGPPWHLPRNVGADFLRQLTTEKLVEKTNARGAMESVWQQIHRDNHFGAVRKCSLSTAICWQAN